MINSSRDSRKQRQLARRPSQAQHNRSFLKPPVVPVPPSTSTEVEFGGVDLVEHYRSEWQELCDSIADDPSGISLGSASAVAAADFSRIGPFFRPEWIDSYLKAFAPDASLAIVTVRREGRLCAILPMIVERSRLLRLRVWRTPTNVHSCRFDLVCLKHESRASIAAIWATLINTPGWDLLQFGDSPQRGGVDCLLEIATRYGARSSQARSISSPYIDLTGTDQKRPSDRVQARLRTKQRKLNALGDISYTSLERAEEGVLEEFFKLEASGWKGREGTAISCDERVKRFYTLIAQQAEREGYLSIKILRCNGRAIAMHLGLQYRNGYFAPKIAYDEQLGKVSPGHLLVREVLEECRRQGLDLYDFLGDQSSWKSAWTETALPHINGAIYRETYRGRLAFIWMVSLQNLLSRIKERLKRYYPVREIRAGHWFSS